MRPFSVASEGDGAVQAVEAEMNAASAVSNRRGFDVIEQKVTKQTKQTDFLVGFEGRTGGSGCIRDVCWLESCFLEGNPWLNDDDGA